MYGGRTSLFISLAAALITTLLSIVLGLVAGYYRGWIDAVIARILDIIWAFPVLLLGIALGTALAVGGLQIGPISISGHLDLDPDADHRRRLRPLHGAAAAGRGAGAARERVRRGGRRPGRRARCG